MMTKQAGRFAKWRVVAAIPVLGVTLLLFAFTEKAQAISPQPEFNGTTETIPVPVQTKPEVTAPVRQPQRDVAPPPAANDEPFVAVEEMPRFQGGDQKSFQQWVMLNLKYPAEAQQKGIEGRVVLGFVIERDGSLSQVEVIESPDRLLTEEAIRTVSASPKWTAGRQRGQNVRVRFTMPLDFRLNNNTQSSSSSDITVVGHGQTSRLGSSDSEPTILVNGERYTGSIEKIAPENIEYINVLKNDPAYPNGVIQITLKEEVSGNTSIAIATPRNEGSHTDNIQKTERESNRISVAVTGTQGQEGRIRISGINSTEGSPLFIVDGTTVSGTLDIDEDKIESISVLKDESSIREYGEAGKNGVVIITTKEAAGKN